MDRPLFGSSLNVPNLENHHLLTKRSEPSPTSSSFVNGTKTPAVSKNVTRVPPLREAARSSPAYLSAGRTRAHPMQPRSDADTFNPRSFQVCAFSFYDAEFVRYSVRAVTITLMASRRSCAVTFRNAVKCNGPIEHATGSILPAERPARGPRYKPHRSSPPPTVTLL